MKESYTNNSYLVYKIVEGGEIIWNFCVDKGGLFAVLSTTDV